jgi:hypothetical protein
MPSSPHWGQTKASSCFCYQNPRKSAQEKAYTAIFRPKNKRLGAAARRQLSDASRIGQSTTLVGGLEQDVQIQEAASDGTLGATHRLPAAALKAVALGRQAVPGRQQVSS